MSELYMYEMTETEQVSYLSGQVMNLNAEVAVAREQLAAVENLLRIERQTNDAHVAWKELLVSDAHEFATENSLCHRFDDFMEEHGMPRRMRDYIVYCDVTMRVRVQVSAQNDDDATEMVERDGIMAAVRDAANDSDYYDGSIPGVRDWSVDYASEL